MASLAGAILILGGGFAVWKMVLAGGKTAPPLTTPAEPDWPNTLAELNAWYVEPPAGQNGAPLFLKAFDGLQVSAADRNSQDLPLIGKGTLPALGAPLTTRSKAAIRAFLQRNQITGVREAGKLDKTRYPIDLNQGYATPLPHVAKVKRAAQLSALHALLLTDSKQPQAAVDFLLDSLSVAQSLKSEPLLISQLVRASCLTLLRETLEHIINLAALQPHDLARLEAALAKAEEDESAGMSFTSAGVGERANVLAALGMSPDKLATLLRNRSGSRTEDDAPSAQNPGASLQADALKKLTRNLAAQRAFAEETFNRTLALRRLPLPARLEADACFTARLAEAKAKGFQLCLMLMPSLGRMTVREAGVLAELRLAQTAIALERYRAAHDNRYPSALGELTPSFLPIIPQDPFNVEPLRYQRAGDGYELQSVGAEPAKPITFKVINPPRAIPVAMSAASQPRLEVPQAHYHALADGVGLLTVPGFDTDAFRTVERALGHFATNNVRHVILDVRGNQGGSLQAAIDLISLFIGKETPLWGYRRVNQTEVKTNFGTRNKVWSGGLLVLVNGKTASAGELLASACQTSGRAKVWGQITLGAGSIYMLRRGSDGQMKREEAGEFLTVKGEPINGRGVTPDVITDVSLPDEELFAKVSAFLKGTNTNGKSESTRDSVVRRETP